MEEERRAIETADFAYIPERARQYNLMNATPVSAQEPTHHRFGLLIHLLDDFLFF